MQLFVVRHGECEANVHGVVAGARDDSPLNARGEQEARDTAQKLHGFQGTIVSSPLRRARKTAEIIRDIVSPGAEIRIDPAFIERDVGDATGLPLDQYFAMEKSDKPIPNAETDAAMFERVRQGVEHLKALNGPILLVTHNGTYRMLVTVLTNQAPHTFANVPSIDNGEVKILEI